MAPTQCVCIARWCVTARFLLNWNKFNDRTFFSKRAHANAEELIKKP